MFARLKALKTALFGRSVVTMRLLGEIRAAEIELDVTRTLFEERREDVEVSEDLPSWERAARNALRRAEEELLQGQVEVGWIYYFSAKRMELVAFRELSPTSLVARATVLYREAANVLDPWRLATIEDLLYDDGEIKSNVSLAEMYEASKVLQDYHVESYLRIETFRKQLWQFIAIGALTIGFILLYALGVRPLFTEIGNDTGSMFLVPVVLFGILGASVSGLLSLDERSIEVEREAQPLSRWLSLARAVLGGAAAIALFAFLQSGLIQLGTLTPGLALAVSFIAGFTERLLIRAIETVLGDQPESYQGR